MDHNRIRELLKKYWEGEAGVDEEIELKHLFSKVHDLPGELRAEQSLFAYYQQEAARSFLPHDRLKEFENSAGKSRIVKPLWSRKLFRYAAILVPALIAGYLIVGYKKNDPNAMKLTDTFTDKEKAIEETEKALMLLSRNLNDGLSKVSVFDMLDDVELSDKIKQ